MRSVVDWADAVSAVDAANAASAATFAAFLIIVMLSSQTLVRKMRWVPEGSILVTLLKTLCAEQQISNIIIYFCIIS